MGLRFLIPAIAVILSATALCIIVFMRKTIRKVSYMLDALEDGETNFRFGKGNIFERRLNRTLNRLRDIFDREIIEIRDKERYYGQVLDNVQTGIVVAQESNGRIIYSNNSARRLLNVSGLSSVRQLANIDAGLYEAFSTVQEGCDKKVSFYNERGQCRISISASSDHIDGKPVTIIIFNDISIVTEEMENESWSKLIRVLTHEIMNTVTPIASLSEALQNVKGPELKAGLETISSSSRELIRFVESYRDLSRVAAPVKRAFYVRDLVSNVLELSAPLLEESGAVATFEEKAEDILLYADQGQISQILVNLVKNAVQAGAAHVDITADIDRNDSVVIDVSNDGPAISPESQEEIFVPFFTTKPEGTGIGLSLSRQIMRMHGGNLRLLKSDAAATVFSLIFR